MWFPPLFHFCFCFLTETSLHLFEEQFCLFMCQCVSVFVLGRRDRFVSVLLNCGSGNCCIFLTEIRLNIIVGVYGTAIEYVSVKRAKSRTTACSSVVSVASHKKRNLYLGKILLCSNAVNCNSVCKFSQFVSLKCYHDFAVACFV